MKNSLKANQAFTLIELLVVIAIIGVLASIILVALNSARVKAKDGKIIADVQQIRVEAFSKFNGADYSAALNPGNSTPGNANGIIAGSGTKGKMLTDDAVAQGGSVFAITNAGPTQFAIYGSLQAQPANTYFCLDSTGRSDQAVTTATPTVACP